MVVMGRVTAPFGVKGWVKIYALTAQPGNLCDYPVWWLQREGSWRETKVVAARLHGKQLVAQLAGIDSREAAAGLKGVEIGVPREQLPHAAKNEFYWADLIGLKVVNAEQYELGRVVRIVQTGANDVLVVAGGEEKSDGRAEGARRKEDNKRADGAQRKEDNKRAEDAQRKEAREILIPFIADAIKAVDVAAGVIAVDWGRDY